MAEVEVDVVLGTTKVLRMVAAHDVGRAVNPTLVEGQIHGGIAQGLGFALMEEFIPGRTENLHDYLIPTVGDMPEIDIRLIEDPEPEGPFGAKGVGEPALVATAPAILSAIRHATGVDAARSPGAAAPAVGGDAAKPSVKGRGWGRTRARDGPHPPRRGSGRPRSGRASPPLGVGREHGPPGAQTRHPRQRSAPTPVTRHRPSRAAGGGGGGRSTGCPPRIGGLTGARGPAPGGAARPMPSESCGGTATSLPLEGTHFRRQVPIGPYIADFGCQRPSSYHRARWRPS